MVNLKLYFFIIIFISNLFFKDYFFIIWNYFYYQLESNILYLINLNTVKLTLFLLIILYITLKVFKIKQNENLLNNLNKIIKNLLSDQFVCEENNNFVETYKNVYSCSYISLNKLNICQAKYKSLLDINYCKFNVIFLKVSI